MAQGIVLFTNPLRSFAFSAPLQLAPHPLNISRRDWQHSRQPCPITAGVTKRYIRA